MFGREEPCVTVGNDLAVAIVQEACFSPLYLKSPPKAIALHSQCVTEPKGAALQQTGAAARRLRPLKHASCMETPSRATHRPNTLQSQLDISHNRGDRGGIETIDSPTGRTRRPTPDPMLPTSGSTRQTTPGAIHGTSFNHSHIRHRETRVTAKNLPQHHPTSEPRGLVPTRLPSNLAGAGDESKSYRTVCPPRKRNEVDSVHR